MPPSNRKRWLSPPHPPKAHFLLQALEAPLFPNSVRTSPGRMLQCTLGYCLRCVFSCASTLGFLPRFPGFSSVDSVNVKKITFLTELRLYPRGWDEPSPPGLLSPSASRRRVRHSPPRVHECSPGTRRPRRLRTQVSPPH